jgi:hypothetical protein
MAVLIGFTFAIVDGCTGNGTDVEKSIAITTTIWAGLLIPLVILLPIWAVGLLNTTDKQIVMVFILLFLALGNMYSGVLYLISKEFKVLKSIFIYCYLVVGPLCVYAPIYMYVSYHGGVILFSFTYGSAILFTLGHYYYKNGSGNPGESICRCCVSVLCCCCNLDVWLCYRGNNDGNDPKQPVPVPNNPLPSAPPGYATASTGIQMGGFQQSNISAFKSYQDTVDTVPVYNSGSAYTASYAPAYVPQQLPSYDSYSNVPTAQVVEERTQMGGERVQMGMMSENEKQVMMV